MDLPTDLKSFLFHIWEYDPALRSAEHVYLPKSKKYLYASGYSTVLF